MLHDYSKFPRISFTRLNKLISRSLAREFQKHDLSVTNEQELILRYLRMSGSMSQTELAVSTGQDRFNISRTVALLEKKGLLLKEPHPTDQRYCNISITPEGDRLHEQLWEILEDWRGKLFRGIDPGRLRAYAETSEELTRNANSMLGGEEE